MLFSFSHSFSLEFPSVSLPLSLSLSPSLSPTIFLPTLLSPHFSPAPPPPPLSLSLSLYLSFSPRDFSSHILSLLLSLFPFRSHSFFSSIIYTTTNSFRCDYSINLTLQYIFLHPVNYSTTLQLLYMILVISIWRIYLWSSFTLFHMLNSTDTKITSINLTHTQIKSNIWWIQYQRHPQRCQSPYEI